VCPKPDMDLTELQRRIEALEVTSLAQRLSRAELRLKEMGAARQGEWKKFSDP
jgi:hypothetical protein